MSLRDKALEHPFRETTVDVPEWGGKVVVREMSASQRERHITNRVEGYLYADVVISCTYDPDTNEPVFDPADRDALAASPAGPIERVFGEIASLSRVEEGAVETVKEELEGDPFDGSS